MAARSRRPDARYGDAVVVPQPGALPRRASDQPAYDRPMEIATLLQEHGPGEEHHVVRYPRGLRGRLHRHTAAHTIVVLHGSMSINGNVIGPGGYAHVPAGEPMLHEPAEGEECTFLILFHGPFDLEVLDG